MATFSKFECFVGDLGDKVHDLDADALKVYLTNATPSASADSVKTDLAEITAQNVTLSYSGVRGYDEYLTADVIFTEALAATARMIETKAASVALTESVSKEVVH